MEFDATRIRKILENRTSVNSLTGCWEYLSTNAGGYGQITIDGKFYYVHRLSAQIFLGYSPGHPDLNVLHKVICPCKACWNPEHLYIGTIADNNKDIKFLGSGKGRFSDVTHCVNGHEFTKENTYWSTRNTGEPRRHCRECRAIRDRKRKSWRKGKNSPNFSVNPVTGQRLVN